jgi:hypothetical protein
MNAVDRPTVSRVGGPEAVRAEPDALMGHHKPALARISSTCRPRLKTWYGHRALLMISAKTGAGNSRWDRVSYGQPRPAPAPADLAIPREHIAGPADPSLVPTASHHPVRFRSTR